MPSGLRGLAGLRGAAPSEVRSPSLAGGRALRRPEHPWGHKHPQRACEATHYEAARPHRDQAAHTSGDSCQKPRIS